MDEVLDFLHQLGVASVWAVFTVFSLPSMLVLLVLRRLNLEAYNELRRELDTDRRFVVLYGYDYGISLTWRMLPDGLVWILIVYFLILR